MAGTPAQEVRNGQICPGTPECRGLCYDLIIIHKIFGLIELNFLIVIRDVQKGYDM